jgi:hypothetical protein
MDVLQRDEKELFTFYTDEQFDFIITNPPWGGKQTKNQKDVLLQRYPELSTTETFSISLFNCLKKISKDGKLYFFLPHSILNVSAHKNIRKVLLSSDGSIFIKLLGNAFKGVLSEAILLRIENGISSETIIVEQKNNEHSLIHRNSIDDKDCIISANSLKIDNEIIKRIFSKKNLFLKNNAVFALGIVTGNNEKHIIPVKTDKTEPIYKGKDIQRFHYSTASCFIEFCPDLYQQVAPVKYFRQRKIVYRFISDKIICAIDEQKHLVLNSANLFIPTFNYPFETIVCLFNSSIYSYIYQKKYHSTKVLRSHIEELPLPVIDENTHNNFKLLYQHILDGNDEYILVERLVAQVFELSENELEYIQGCVNGNSK